MHRVRVDDNMQPVEGIEFSFDADLVLLVMGFVGPVREGMIATLSVKINRRGNVFADTNAFRSSLTLAAGSACSRTSSVDHCRTPSGQDAMLPD